MNDNQTSPGVVRVEDIQNRLNLFVLDCFQVVAMSMEKLLVVDRVVPAMSARTAMVNFQSVSMFEEQVADGAFSLLSFEQKRFYS